jgi:hypothetical protein
MTLLIEKFLNIVLNENFKAAGVKCQNNFGGVFFLTLKLEFLLYNSLFIIYVLLYCDWFTIFQSA